MSEIQQMLIARQQRVKTQRRRNAEGARPRQCDVTRSYTDVFADGMWNGRRCFIVGGGPSLKGFDWSRISKELVIGVNRVFEFCDPTILFSMDDRYRANIENPNRHMWYGLETLRKFNETPALKVWKYEKQPDWPFGPDVLQWACPDPFGFSGAIVNGLGGGSNSGFGALNFAWLLGANPIYMLGFDMKGDSNGKQAWFHAGHPDSQQARNIYPKFSEFFCKIAPGIAAEGVRVVNLCRDSALECFEKGDLDDVSPVDTPLVVAYYTQGTGYVAEADGLRESLRPFAGALDHDIVPAQNLGSWQRNTSHKPRILQALLDAHPGRALLYVDADARFRRYPIWCDDADVDFAAHWRDYSEHPSSSRKSGKELLSGTLYLRNTPAVKALVADWAAECDKSADWDQRVLVQVLEQHRDKVRVGELPATYCQIFDLMKNAGDPVIEHMQASRRLRREIG